ncbi:hypothetical protein H4219_000822 [Mycoemilia scoparia]|uniref:2-dehydropantoate 2-reductase n=1 Tax=Mycoemilia scoparia TaxID=417184 RepID=A0A9W8A678_9FUNG|nr:hypothetical protein H4219_000822 [Mycoemilia scoparia]
MLKFLLIGTGSLGSVVLWRLKNGGKDDIHVTALCRSNYEAVTNDGFHFTSKIFGSERWHPDRVVADVQEAVANGETYDYVLIALKALPNLFCGAYMTAPAIQNSHTCIVLIQNGLGIEEPYERLFPYNPLVSVVSYIDAYQTDPGYVQHGLMSTVAIGYHCGQYNKYTTNLGNKGKDHLKILDQFFVESGVDCIVAENIQQYRWLKQVHNAVFNPMSVLSGGKDVGSILRHPTLSKIAHKAMQEVWKAGLVVTNSSSYPYVKGEDSIDSLVKRILARPLPLWTSMWRDFQGRRPLEHNVIVKNTIDIAAKHGIAMPHLETIYAHLVVLEETYMPNTPP